MIKVFIIVLLATFNGTTGPMELPIAYYTYEECKADLDLHYSDLLMEGNRQGVTIIAGDCFEVEVPKEALGE